jgi:hypothetical protein
MSISIDSRSATSSALNCLRFRLMMMNKTTTAMRMTLIEGQHDSSASRVRQLVLWSTNPPMMAAGTTLRSVLLTGFSQAGPVPPSHARRSTYGISAMVTGITRWIGWESEARRVSSPWECENEGLKETAKSASSSNCDDRRRKEGERQSS